MPGTQRGVAGVKSAHRGQTEKHRAVIIELLPRPKMSFHRNILITESSLLKRHLQQLFAESCADR